MKDGVVQTILTDTVAAAACRARNWRVSLLPAVPTASNAEGHGIMNRSSIWFLSALALFILAPTPQSFIRRVRRMPPLMRSSCRS